MLEISSEYPTDQPMNWISQLVSLRSLDLTFRSFERYSLHHLVTLTNLTSLDLSTELELEDAEDVICLNVHWHQLQSLKRLSITGVQASFRQNSLSLLQLKSLTSVTFDLMPSDSRDMAYFADLIYRLSNSCPDVFLSVENRRLGATA